MDYSSKWIRPETDSGWLWQTSLVSRLVLSFLLLSLVTMIVLGFVAYLHERGSLEDSARGRLEVAVTLKTDALARWVDDQWREFLIFSELPALRAVMEKLVTRTGAGRAAVYDELAPQLAIVAERKSEWQETLILADNSEILLSTDRSHEGDHRILDRYFVAGKKGPHIARVYPSPLTYRPTMTFSAPLGEPASRAAGVVAVHLDLSWLDTILFERPGLGEGSESYLVDRAYVFLSGQRFGRDNFRRGVHSEGIDKALLGQSGSGRYRNYRGVPVLGVYRMVESLDAALLIEIPESEVFAPSRRLLDIFVLVGLASAAFLATAIYLLARQITRPVMAVSDAVVRVAEGDLEARAPAVTRDEVGTLARAFNQMTERVARLIQELEARNDELTRFSYTVSHDLKSPLVTIRGFVGLLEKDIEAGNRERITEDLARISSATQKMQLLLDELLEISRVEQQAPAEEDVLLDDLVPEVLKMTEGRLRAARVEVTVADDLGVVRGDRLRLLQVFQNLIDNAARFMGDEPVPRIEIGTKRQDRRILCHVRDNGIGIDSAYHDKVFGLFERLDPEVEGTGVGLALVQRIVELHDGRIWIESAGAGAGTTFFFTLRAAA